MARKSSSYQVLVSPSARQDIIATADHLRAKIDSKRATQWKNELLQAIASLKEMPFRCPVADESEEVGLELRELHFRPHRVISTIDAGAQTVQILRVYHSARVPLRLEELR